MEHIFYQFNDADLTELINKVKDIVVNNLCAEGILTEEQRKSYVKSHIITVARKSHLFPWWKKKAPENENCSFYISKLAYEEDDDI